MGIKTKFCPMGGDSSEKGSLSLWRYSNDVVEGRTLLYNYIGGQTLLRNGYTRVSGSGIPLYLNYGVTPNVGEYMLWKNGVKTSYRINRIINSNYFYTTATSVPFNRNTSVDVYSGASYPDTLYVPRVGGKALINDWVNSATSGTTESNRNIPFFNNPYVNNVDLQGVNFNNNRMYYAFNNCLNLVSVNRISSDVTNMYFTFYNCRKLISVDSLPSSVTNMASTFYNCTNFNQNIQISSSVTNMASTFYYCTNLNQNIQIPSSVTSMTNTFYYCYKLNQNIQIPSSVKSMNNTFSICSNLNQNIQIPNSVTYMDCTFKGCSNLNQNIRIPSSVTNMADTFHSCTRLNQNIQIPSSVTSMINTFYYCTGLNQNIQIPSSVTSMINTFYYCMGLNQNIQIPSSVINMYGTFSLSGVKGNKTIPATVTNFASTFYDCKGIIDCWINIDSAQITNATNSFSNIATEYAGPPNVYIISRNPDNSHTATYNSFNSAGWLWSEGNVVGNEVNSKIRTWSLGYSNAEPIFNVQVNGVTSVVLNKWHGKLDTFLNNDSIVYDVNFPRYLGFGGKVFTNYPTAISNTCFQSNAEIRSINCNNAPMYSTGVNAFRQIDADVTHCIVSEGISNVYGMFCNCNGHRIQVTSTPTATEVPEGTAYADLPNSVTNIRTFFDHTDYIRNHYIKALSITGTSNSSWYIFGGQKFKTSYYINVSVPGGFGNAQYFYLLAPNMTVVTNLFYNYSNEIWKKLYIYYTYANGVNTKTFNTIKNLAVYKGTSGNGAGVMPLYNSTSKFAVYDYGNCPV